MTHRAVPAERAGIESRMTGVRVGYDTVPVAVRGWVEAQLGSAVIETTPRTGGMSPAAAVSVRSASGRTAFVKAVGTQINPDTPQHFRHEVSVLGELPPVSYRADLLAAYDDDDWVAILLEDIGGGHPDLADLTARARVLDAVLAQTAELAGHPGPPGVASLTEAATDVWLSSLDDASADELAALPDWYRSRVPEMRELIVRGLGSMVEDTYCNFDVRVDNLVVRPESGQPVIVDWGMSRRGPRWTDVVCLALEWVDLPQFDEVVGAVDPTAVEGEQITAFLLGLGARLATVATHAAPPGLPQLPAFRASLARRCLEGARRRLGL